MDRSWMEPKRLACQATTLKRPATKCDLLIQLGNIDVQTSVE